MMMMTVDPVTTEPLKWWAYSYTTREDVIVQGTVFASSFDDAGQQIEHRHRIVLGLDTTEFSITAQDGEVIAKTKIKSVDLWDRYYPKGRVIKLEEQE